MQDPRLDRLADLVVGYSVGLERGDVVTIEGVAETKPLLLALYRAALRADARPKVIPRFEDVEELLIAEGNDAQLAWVSPLDMELATHVDARITVFSEVNPRRHMHADAARQAAFVGARRVVSNAFWERVETGSARWCGTFFPTPGHAQDAGMSVRDYEDFVFRACHVDGDGDPVAFWRGFAEELRARAASLDPVRVLRLLGEDTDLVLGLEGRRWLTGEGHRNMPDGEIFTSPVETSVRGEVAFAYPAIYEGREVQGVRLRFEDGQVVHAEARDGEDHLRAMLALDEGANRLGEVAIGLNYGIDRHTGNVLFDEKIGGTIHLALGAGFAEAGGSHQSRLHWDMVTPLGTGGEIQADGETIWRDGSFI